MQRLTLDAPVPDHLRDAILALGNFDGFHLGHQAVVGRAVQRAAHERRPVIVGTFDPHPVRYFDPHTPPFRLTSLEQRERLFAQAGADAMVVFHFDAALAATSAEDFIADLLAARIGAKGVVTGIDFTFGANRGKLCSKGTHLGETIGLEGRLLHPMIGDARASWDEALDLVAGKFAATIAEHGPDSVAFYGSGQLLTEDYYAFNKLMKGFIGSANIDTNSRLCMASAVVAHVRAFGEDLVPACYDDLDEADLVVLVGSNTAWCHPVIWQRIEAARAARGTKLVVIDPRRTETAELADLHMPLRGGSDVALFNGLLAHLHAAGATDREFLERSVAVPDGFKESK